MNKVTNKEIDEIAINISTIYNRYKFLIISINLNSDFLLRLLYNSKIGGIISYSNYSITNNKIITRREFIVRELKNNIYYGATLYFHFTTDIHNIINTILELEYYIYVFVYEYKYNKYIIKPKDLINWDITVYDNYLIGVNKNIKKSEGVKNKFGLKQTFASNSPDIISSDIDTENIKNEILNESVLIDIFKNNGFNINSIYETTDMVSSIKLPDTLLKIYSTLPTPSKNFIEFGKVYDKELKQYLRILLGTIIKNDILLDTILAERNFPIWKKAFTHVTYDYSNNFEELEFIGDAVFKNSFKRILSKKFPTITARASSEFHNQYGSTPGLSQFGLHMKLHKWLIHRNLNLNGLNIKILEDLFESFIGALVTVCDDPRNGNFGSGNINAYNFITELFSIVSFPKYMVYGLPKTSLFQRLEMLGFQKPNTLILNSIRNEKTNKFDVEISISDAMISKLIALGFNVDYKNKILGKSSHFTIKTAINIACGNTIEFIETRYNITYENCKLRSLLLKLDNFNATLVTSCLKKAALLGLDYLELYQPKNTYSNTSVTTILYGFDSRIPDPIIENRPKQILAIYTEVYNKRGDDKYDISFKSKEGALISYLEN